MIKQLLFWSLGLLFLSNLHAQQSVQIVHNAILAGIDSVDIYLDDVLVADDIKYREATAFLGVGTGFAKIDIAADTSTSSAQSFFTDSVMFSANENKMVMVGGILNDPMFPVDLFVNDNTLLTNPSAGTVLLNSYHGATNAPTIDIEVRNFSTLIGDSISYSDYSDYASFNTSSDVLLDLKNEASGNIIQTYIYPVPPVLATVFASGILGGTPAFGLFAVTPDGTVFELMPNPIATFQIVHAVDSLPVDIYIDGTLAIDSFLYLTATSYNNIGTGVTYNIQVANANSTSAADAFFSKSFSPENGRNYQIFAAGELGSATNPFDLFINENARIFSQNNSGADIAFFNGATGIDPISVYDIINSTTEVPMLSFGEYSDYLNTVLAVNLYRFALASNNLSLLATIADITGTGGLGLTIFTTTGDDGMLDAHFVIPNGLVISLDRFTIPAAQFIHNSPGEDIDVYLNGILVINDLSFRDAIPYTFLPGRTDTFSIAIAPDTSTTVASAFYTDSFIINDGSTNIIIANGVRDDMEFPFELINYVGGRVFSFAGPGFFELNFFHGSLGTPEFNVFANGTPLAEFDELSYKDFGDSYITLPISEYQLELTKMDDSPIGEGTFDASLYNGNAGLVFASGYFDGSDPAFELWMALPNGITFPLNFTILSNEDLKSTISSFSIYPNPAAFDANVRVEFDRNVNNAHAYIFSADGRVVQTRKLGDLTAGEHNLHFDVTNLESGTYYMTLVSEQGYASYPLIVARP